LKTFPVRSRDPAKDANKDTPVADSTTQGGKTKDSARNGEPVVIKKYANRRLYNT
jgi:hypothetical protein